MFALDSVCVREREKERGRGERERKRGRDEEAKGLREREEGREKGREGGREQEREREREREREKRIRNKDRHHIINIVTTPSHYSTKMLQVYKLSGVIIGSAGPRVYTTTQLSVERECQPYLLPGYKITLITQIDS